jgi:hypothetical protein
MKIEGALEMRFARHHEIYRSEVSLLPVNWAWLPPPVGRHRSPAIGRDGRSTPCPSFSMSFGRLFLDRVARQQSPSPLHRQPQHKPALGWKAAIFQRTATNPLTSCLTPGVHCSSLHPASCLSILKVSGNREETSGQERRPGFVCPGGVAARFGTAPKRSRLVRSQASFHASAGGLVDAFPTSEC